MTKDSETRGCSRGQNIEQKQYLAKLPIGQKWQQKELDLKHARGHRYESIINIDSATWYIVKSREFNGTDVQGYSYSIATVQSFLNVKTLNNFT
jgi:hypothetical protein